MHNNGLINALYKVIVKYPTPSNLNYLWSFGIFAFVALILQIITGIVLVMMYTPHVDYAFASIEHIMRDVNAGWILRYCHANGASLFFIVVYAHIVRGLYYGSYLFTRELLWCSGVIILLLMIITAFLGYILPWGQMSLWGATVITNLASTIPVIGDIIVSWLWGGFSVANPTLNKFFSLHYLLPFLIVVVVIIHILLLHNYGSSNPLGLDYKVDTTAFSPHYIIKDVFSLFGFFIILAILVFFIPNTLGHPDNYIPANPDVTPAHIVPEWYFLPFYAISRAIPDKALGVIALLASIVMLGLLPFLHKSHIRNVGFKPISKFFVLLFITTVILLTYFGAQPIEEPFTLLSQYCTIAYFSFFFILPLINALELALTKYICTGTGVNPRSITATVISMTSTVLTVVETYYTSFLYERIVYRFSGSYLWILSFTWNHLSRILYALSGFLMDFFSRTMDILGLILINVTRLVSKPFRKDEYLSDFFGHRVPYQLPYTFSELLNHHRKVQKNVFVEQDFQKIGNVKWYLFALFAAPGISIGTLFLNSEDGWNMRVYWMINILFGIGLSLWIGGFMFLINTLGEFLVGYFGAK
jgi:quinol-cytochrome oxidoreductase complex cytochrome b subunit